MEAGIEPKLEREVVPLLISEIRAQFVLVPLSEQSLVELSCLCKKLRILQVYRAVAHELGKDDVMNLKRQKSKSRKIAREEFRETALIILRDISDSDMLEVQSVLFVQCGTLPSDAFKVSDTAGWYCSDIVDVAGRAWQAVKRG
jgi:hypothetical protein